MGKSCNVWCQCHSKKNPIQTFSCWKSILSFDRKSRKFSTLLLFVTSGLKFTDQNSCKWTDVFRKADNLCINDCIVHWHNLTSNIKNTKGDSIEYQFECNRYFNIYGHLHIKWIEDCLQITFELNWIIHQMYTQFILRILVFTSVLRCKFAGIDNNFKFLRIFWISNRKWDSEWIIQNPLLLIRFIWVNRTVISYLNFD